MKKLMIAAAAAAMISGAFAAADEIGYDFTASVKTTQGKGNTVKTTYNISLGQDASGWWYEDSNVITFLKAETGIDLTTGSNKEKETKAKKAMGKLKTNDQKIDFINYVAGGDFPENIEKITDMNNKVTYVLFDGTDTMFDVMEYYKKKWVWCYTFKVTDSVTDCYRAPTTVKLTGSLFMENCCADIWELVVKDFGKTFYPGEQLDVTHPLLYRINGLTLAKANKVEVTGVIGPAGIEAYDGEKGGLDDTAVGTFAYAGQGDFDVKAEQIKNVSGDIVGVLADPDCEDCCLDDAYAMFFVCYDEDDTITWKMWGGDGDDAFGTAAFGTFSFKYNKKTTR